MSNPGTFGGGRFPAWVKARLPSAEQVEEVRRLLAETAVSTVCSSARCPNMGECFARRTATFLIMGPACTRQCRFCAIAKGRPAPLRENEPQAVAQAAAELGLKHVVITSVTRDDLPDGGAGHFAATIRAVRAHLPQAAIEALTSDFAGDARSLAAVLDACPDVFNLNLETVRRLTPLVRGQGDYARSLALLSQAAQAAVRGKPVVKSGLMVGLGETAEEVVQALRDLRAAGCRIVTIGQYLAPSPSHAPVVRFVTPSEFGRYRDAALKMGFSAAACGPLVRSSYLAEDLFCRANAVH